MDTFSTCPPLSTIYRGQAVPFNKIFDKTYNLYKRNKQVGLDNKFNIELFGLADGMDDSAVVMWGDGSGNSAFNITSPKGEDHRYQAELSLDSSEGMRTMCWGILRQNREVAMRGYDKHRESGSNLITNQMDGDMPSQEYKDFADKLMEESANNKKYIVQLDTIKWWKTRFNGKKVYKFCQ
tara:strand:- start:1419 stop:1961 length:543 start_codon:yes stop_codon:yes gene_type:complete